VNSKTVETFYGEDFDGGEFNNFEEEVDDIVLEKLEDIFTVRVPWRTEA